MNEKLTEFISMAKRAADESVLRKLVISKLKDKTIKKAVLEPKSHKGRILYTVETHLQDGKKTQKNYAEFPERELSELIGSSMQANLLLTQGECEYRTSKSGNAAILGQGKLDSAIKTNSTVHIQELNREKNYILSGDEPFLYELDITDKNGRIKDKRQAKFRQICRFLEYVRDILPHLPKDKVVIYDLCCGKSYLSFAVYYYFHDILCREVEMLCVDLKADVMHFCSEVADKLGYAGMIFRSADITKLQATTPPDLVLSLHACDTATDLVLENAVRLGARVILSTPCCHRDLSRRIKCPELSFATEHSILRSKLCDALTDSLRLVYLEKEGYKVDACELVDPEDTPKNVILRAHKTSRSEKQLEDKREQYERIREFLGI